MTLGTKWPWWVIYLLKMGKNGTKRLESRNVEWVDYWLMDNASSGESFLFTFTTLWISFHILGGLFILFYFYCLLIFNGLSVHGSNCWYFYFIYTLLKMIDFQIWYFSKIVVKLLCRNIVLVRSGYLGLCRWRDFFVGIFYTDFSFEILRNIIFKFTTQFDHNFLYWKIHTFQKSIPMETPRLDYLQKNNNHLINST